MYEIFVGQHDRHVHKRVQESKKRKKMHTSLVSTFQLCVDYILMLELKAVKEKRDYADKCMTLYRLKECPLSTFFWITHENIEAHKYK